MKQFFTSILLICSLFSYAQQYERIPDENFRKALQEFFPEAFDAEDNMDITHPAITGAVELNISRRDIGSLEGLHYFVGLKTLICSENPLNVLPDLPASLEKLACLRINISVLPELPSGLREIYCVYNAVQNLPALPASLRVLEVSYNNITSLPRLPDSLAFLGCLYNDLNQLPLLPDSLKKLACSYNQLDALPELPAQLEELQCAGNFLRTLPELPATLNSLYAFDNCFDPVPVNPGHISLFEVGPNRPDCLVTALQTEKHIWTLYPNPVSDRLYLGELLDHVEVYNAQGQLTGSYRKVEQISVSDWPEGIYMLRSGERTSRIVRQ